MAKEKNTKPTKSNKTKPVILAELQAAKEVIEKLETANSQLTLQNQDLNEELEAANQAVATANQAVVEANQEVASMGETLNLAIDELTTMKSDDIESMVAKESRTIEPPKKKTLEEIKANYQTAYESAKGNVKLSLRKDLKRIEARIETRDAEEA